MYLYYSVTQHGCMVWSLPESQMRKNNKNILVVPELSSIKSSQGACAENVESLRPQMAPSVGLISQVWFFTRIWVTGPGTQDLGHGTQYLLQKILLKFFRSSQLSGVVTTKSASFVVSNGSDGGRDVRSPHILALLSSLLYVRTEQRKVFTRRVR